MSEHTQTCTQCGYIHTRNGEPITCCPAAFNKKHTVGGVRRERQNQMIKYGFNKFQKAAFHCWVVGAALILIPFGGMFLTPDNTTPWAVAIGLGIVALAIGGSLHKVGTGRDKQN